MHFGLILGVLALIGGLLYRGRLTRVVRSTDPVLTDDLVREIEATGRLDVDEPLDLEQIQEEEARFWEQHPWEDSEEW